MTDRAKPGWTFLTNHAHVLVSIAEEPDIRGRDIAARVGITERATQSIVSDLVAAEYVTRTRQGRRNHYSVDLERPLRHPLAQGHTVGELLGVLAHLAAPPSPAGAPDGTAPEEPTPVDTTG